MLRFLSFLDDLFIVLNCMMDEVFVDVEKLKCILLAFLGFYRPAQGYANSFIVSPI